MGNKNISDVKLRMKTFNETNLKFVLPLINLIIPQPNHITHNFK